MNKTVKGVVIPKSQHPEEWNIEAIGAPNLWRQGLTGEGIKVAVIDSGVTRDDLESHIIARWSWNDTHRDRTGHGTAVAGIIVDVAPAAQLLVANVYDERRGNVHEALGPAVDWAVEQGADVINVSLASTWAVPPLRDAVNRAVAKGVVVVAGVGNDGNAFRYTPSEYDNVIGVGASTFEGQLAKFSNRHDQTDILAPGEGIRLRGAGSSYYYTSNGTSYASPHVAGALALLIPAWRKELGRKLTVAEVRERLLALTAQTDSDWRVLDMCGYELPLPTVQRRVNVKCGDKLSAGYLIDDTAYVPLRWVSENLGASVTWDNVTKTAHIEKPKQ